MKKQKILWLLSLLSIITLAACSSGVNTGLSQEQANGTAVSATLSTIRSTSNAMISTSSPATSAPPIVEPGSNMPLSLGSLRLIYLDASHNLWIWNEGQTPVQLTTSNDVTQASISPDGGTVVYFRSQDQVHVTIWAIQSDGSNPRQLIGSDFFSQLPAPKDALAINPQHMAWIPGTLNLMFNNGAIFEMGSSPLDDLWIVNTSTGSYRSVKEAGKGGNFAISPDGKKVAIILPTSLSILFLDSSLETTPLSFPAMITYSKGQYYPVPVWSSDSSHLRVCIPPVDPLADPNEMTLAVYDVPTAGSPASLLNQFQVRPFSQFLISPNLAWLLYLTTDTPSSNTVAVHLASLPGNQDITELTTQLDGIFWIPGSNGFVVQNSDPKSTELFGLQPVQYSDLTDFKRVENVQFIDDSRYFFIRDSGGTYELKLGTLGYPNPQPSTLITTLPRGGFSGIPTYSFTK